MIGEKEVRVLLDKMFEIAGHNIKYDEIVNRKDQWFNGYSMTQAQENEWMDWGRAYLKDKVTNPDTTMILVNTTWGLKVFQ
jgi:hypothetical protein